MNSFTFQKARKWSAMSLLATSCVFGAAGTANAGDMATTVIGGGDSRDQSSNYYAGVIHNFNGDMLSNGVLVRVVGLGSNYNYTSTAVAGGKVDGRVDRLEALVGYQKVTDTYALRWYVGLDYENHNLSPDNSFDSNRGTHTGAKVRGEYETDLATPNYLGLMASYGSANARYWASARAGRDFNGYVVGPEAVVLGDREYRENRLGVFLTFRKNLPFLFTVSAGSTNSPAIRAGVVPYVAIELLTTF